MTNKIESESRESTVASDVVEMKPTSELSVGKQNRSYCADCKVNPISTYPSSVELCPFHAAAPALYEACKTILRWEAAERTPSPYDADGGAAFRERIRLCDEAMTRARAALALADGQATSGFPSKPD